MLGFPRDDDRESTGVGGAIQRVFPRFFPSLGPHIHFGKGRQIVCSVYILGQLKNVVIGEVSSFPARIILLVYNST